MKASESARPTSGLNIIYARSRNHCIGHHGGLPWNLPAEYQHFEKVTRGYPVIMGRKSYEDHDGLLPGGTNIIVSSQPDLELEPEAILAASLTDAIAAAANIHECYFVIGGAGLISEAMSKSLTVFESVIDTDIQGDTFLPEFDFTNWRTLRLFEHEADQHHNFRFTAYQHMRLAG